MRRLIILITVLLQFVTAGITKAQIDPHFSQYYAYPLWLNPALTGVINGDLRVNANFKNQWASIGDAYKTGALSVDFKPNEKAGIGFNVINQAAGSAGFNYFAAYGSFGYGIAISEDGNKKLNFGVQAGIINRSFDMNKLQLGNQYDPSTGYNPNMPNFENFSSSSATVFDASAGMFYYDGDPSSTANFFGGVSVSHLTRSRDPFATDGLNAKLPMRYNFHAGVRLMVAEAFDVIPHAIYVRQNKNQIKAFGAYTEMKMANDNGLILGAMYRFDDAAIANIGYHVNSMIIGASYDFNTSALNAASNSRGGIELSVSYVFRKRIQGPEPICPRL
ncbi:PorP/SprF family type IX secretion system membrane protein [Mucilaginibacter sp. UR6-1]|uniref:PorP/SprF family type IX secretion system membrane protein n=1 Tax=Mucilaginibacter sp. UR6-1 TaxID=1435643 RepID=UPI001E6118B3|nr:PorP/SprF family type IX secretion system membrane protein [Mucilaginibacter sp. UR6-1]MCC8408223.1 PorP/SprF family type IX secretion system membrane protein [Mucilaginibacter sp. UR6-1]